ncbi:hypothetical protein AMAG_11755 [Allomyces macrogynus ATCC 38327]|uniref:Uncharacterized protein n=1 Tax=Allomyces macrogynus (strain ATCC 38327) TaxID=578462 RepID=A0A0L0SVM6_ALLM3|nr:hypothetical protein AMAG_11755 [Allomyces macrogynus ATCC 38327]|eukprot:KNE66638.1 hypothetical protein AMAG_11755 [Allomyces macrogynus ATCC 38327]
MCSELITEKRIPEFDNLYLDMNGIIHNCSHPNDDDINFRLTDEQMFQAIFDYIDHLFNKIKPKKVFFMAVDGVAPRAKMNQQRSRRFRTALDTQRRIAQAQRNGEDIDDKTEAFDSNCITPGTPFMKRLSEHLQYFVRSKMTEDANWRNVKVILSGHETPGEGEHKIMEYIRNAKAQDDFDPNTRHCLYGLDADLIMLGLVTHEPHFSLLREEVSFGPKKKRAGAATLESQNFFLMHLSLFREYLGLEFQGLRDTMKIEFNQERVIDDFVLISLFVGNDFLPHLPNLHINEGALAVMFDLYKRVMATSDSYINNDGTIHVPTLLAMLKELESVEAKSFQAFANIDEDGNQLDDDGDDDDPKKQQPRDGITMEQRLLLDDVLNFLDTKELSMAVTTTDAPFLENLCFKLNLYLDVTGDGQWVVMRNEDEDLSDDEGDNVRKDHLEKMIRKPIVEPEPAVPDVDRPSYEAMLHDWKKNYYQAKLEFDVDADPAALKALLCEYIRGLQWVLRYYYDGVASWGWFYPYHYSPHISDFAQLTEADLDLEFELGTPFRPFEQLMGVLPAASRQHVPAPLHELMLSPNSPIIDFYPTDMPPTNSPGSSRAPSVSDVQRSDTQRSDTDPLEPFPPPAAVPAAASPIPGPGPPPQETYTFQLSVPGGFAVAGGAAALAAGIPSSLSIQISPALVTDLSTRLPPSAAAAADLSTAGSGRGDAAPTRTASPPPVASHTFTADPDAMDDGELNDVIHDTAAAPPPPAASHPWRHQIRRSASAALADAPGPSLPGIFPPLPACKCQDEPFNPPHVAAFKRGLCDGLKPMAGFPTFSVLPYHSTIGVHGVHVFESDSRHDSVVLHVDKEQLDAAVVAQRVLGKSVYVDWPMLFEARVEKVADGRVMYDVKTGADRANLMEPHETGDWRNTAHRIQRHVSKRFAVVLEDVQVMVAVRTIKTMVRTLDGSTRREYADELAWYPWQLVVESESVAYVDARFEERAALPLHIEFPVGTRIFYLGKSMYGGPGQVTASYGRTRTLDAMVMKGTITMPDFGHAVLRETKDQYAYKPSYMAARMLNMSGMALAKLTSSLHVVMTTCPGSDTKWNLGLQMKFDAKGFKILGYTQKVNATWEYSNQAIDLIRDFKNQFPEFVRRLETKPGDGSSSAWYRDTDFYPREIAKDKLQEIRDWIRASPVKDFERVHLDAQAMVKDQVRRLEEKLQQSAATATPFFADPVIVKGVPANSVLKSEHAELVLGKQIFSLGDRVLSVADRGKAPLGALGYIVGIEKEHVEVVFDVTFMAGSTLNGRCTKSRGLAMKRGLLLNLTYPQSPVWTSEVKPKLQAKTYSPAPAPTKNAWTGSGQAPAAARTHSTPAGPNGHPQQQQQRAPSAPPQAFSGPQPRGPGGRGGAQQPRYQPQPQVLQRPQQQQGQVPQQQQQRPPTQQQQQQGQVPQQQQQQPRDTGSPRGRRGRGGARGGGGAAAEQVSVANPNELTKLFKQKLNIAGPAPAAGGEASGSAAAGPVDASPNADKRRGRKNQNKQEPAAPTPVDATAALKQALKMPIADPADVPAPPASAPPMATAESSARAIPAFPESIPPPPPHVPSSAPLPQDGGAMVAPPMAGPPGMPVGPHAAGMPSMPFPGAFPPHLGRSMPPQHGHPGMYAAPPFYGMPMAPPMNQVMYQQQLAMGMRPPMGAGPMMAGPPAFQHAYSAPPGAVAQEHAGAHGQPGAPRPAGIHQFHMQSMGPQVRANVRPRQVVRQGPVPPHQQPQQQQGASAEGPAQQGA